MEHHSIFICQQQHIFCYYLGLQALTQQSQTFSGKHVASDLQVGPVSLLRSKDNFAI